MTRSDHGPGVAGYLGCVPSCGWYVVSGMGGLEGQKGEETVTECTCHVKSDPTEEDAYIRALTRVTKMAKAEKDTGTFEAYQFADAILTAIDEELFRD